LKIDIQDVVISNHLIDLYHSERKQETKLTEISNDVATTCVMPANLHGGGTAYKVNLYYFVLIYLLIGCTCGECLVYQLS
jgi:hypothetical protein